MNAVVVELNDRGIRVANESGILIQSPGFAYIDDGEFHLGEEAERKARLRPTSTYNRYWHQLSLDPINHQRFRHHADIAHAHLQHLAETTALDSEVIFAVPGNFSREQLAILLGLAQHTPLKPIGVVDSALAGAIGAQQADTVVYLDQQLHQVVLTRLKRRGGELRTDVTIQIPGVGQQNFMDKMMQQATRLFIDQCRFNPQHNAESEQQLYNALPAWLQQQAQEGSLILELSSGGSVHTAKMPSASLVASLDEYYQNIETQLDELLPGSESQLLLAPGVGELPGLQQRLQRFPGLLLVEPQDVSANALEYRQLITGGDGIHRVQSLPVSEAVASRMNPAPAQPSHVLFRHRALPLDRLQVRNTPTLDSEPADAFAFSLPSAPATLGSFQRQADGCYWQPEVSSLVNGSPVSGRHRLSLGDQIGFAGSDDSMTVIRVDHG